MSRGPLWLEVVGGILVSSLITSSISSIAKFDSVKAEADEKFCRFLEKEKSKSSANNSKVINVFDEGI